jgi:hypothetical protein
MLRWQATWTSDGAQRQQWERQASSADFHTQARILKSEDGRLVLRGTMLGREVVVKHWPIDHTAQRLKAWIGASQAQRHWRAARRLAAAGIPTARPLAVLRGGTHKGGGGFERLIMEALPGRTLLDCAADATVPTRTQHRLAWAAGQLVRQLATAGFFNRDCKPSNIMVVDLERKSPIEVQPEQLSLIDCVGVRCTLLRAGKLERMLASLLIEPLGCAIPPRRALMMRCLLAATAGNRPAARQLWPAIRAIILTHGDPRPRISPLRQAAR